MVSPSKQQYAPPPSQDYSFSGGGGGGGSSSGASGYGYSVSAAAEPTPSPSPPPEFVGSSSRGSSKSNGSSDWRDQHQEEWKPDAHTIKHVVDEADDGTMTSLQRARAVFSHDESPKPRERRQSVRTVRAHGHCVLRRLCTMFTALL